MRAGRAHDVQSGRPHHDLVRLLPHLFLRAVCQCDALGLAHDEVEAGQAVNPG